MSTLATSNPAADTLVGMGQIVAGQPPLRMRAILGSCIGLALYHVGRKTGAMAHIVLPDSAGRDGAPGKFADTAIANMLKVFREQGAPVVGLAAKYTGGANMFAGSGPLQIGDANIKAVVKALDNAGIRVVGHDVGGTRGRRVEFDCASGAMTVQCAGEAARVL